MEKLDIKDLAMFVGFKVQFEEEDDCFECLFIGVDINSEFDSIFLKGPSAILSCRPYNIKPILRPLSDMTEEEAKMILVSAMDNGNWHTASPIELNFIEKSYHYVLGSYKWRLHNGGSGRNYFQITEGYTVNIYPEIFDEKSLKFMPDFKSAKNTYQSFSICKGMIKMGLAPYYFWFEKGLAIDRTKL